MPWYFIVPGFLAAALVAGFAVLFVPAGRRDAQFQAAVLERQAEMRMRKEKTYVQAR